ncbi:serine protease Do [Dongia mobilis]|uniref:Probable periplasmic serine endoprotease DegP-like n=1 Tax=Dongia mobilis TaxID=578943 RepID=A0A4R6WJ58_9PROT|nr:DegQ family serine endoprotease [Dongia mobilis]TDQ78853.1 serine protease Do [Dongia mobilis]
MLARRQARAADIAAHQPKILAVLSLLILLTCVVVAARTADARSAPESFADLAEQSLPAVVNISTTQTVSADSQIQDLDEMFREFLDRQEGNQPRPPRRATSLGSGFVIDPAGYIVTNNHVIENAEEITVITHENEELKATLVGRDEKTDLALLKVESTKPLQAVKWGDSDSLRIGDWVLAIGNPFGLGGTVTAGIVSARQRDINAGPYDDFIQTDASINRGNSGGPMFNMAGEVVGINSAIYSPSGGSVGIGFSIPANLARGVIDQIREFGHPRRGWLGVRIQTVSPELAEALRLPAAKGALVSSVSAAGPADKAGIRQGDVILEFDGREVTEMRSLPRIVADTQFGKKVAVAIWRQGARTTVTVELGELDEAAEAAAQVTQRDGDEATEDEGKGDRIELLGVDVARITDALREQFDLPENAEGVVIVEVDPSSTAAAKDLRPGDIIAEVDQKAVASPGDVRDRVKSAQDNGYRLVTLLINRQGDFQWVAVKIGQN